MENYLKITISIYEDALMALLSLLPFESFEDAEGIMICYIKESEFGASEKIEFENYLAMFQATYDIEIVPPQNWNAVWESNFDPVEVDDFCRIRADFHPYKEGYTFELTITPKMAFGTGHHETTHMMIQQMREVDFKDKKVFDYGCGTGILAILAKLLGAKEVVAVDIEEPSYESTIENAENNNAPLTKVYHGDIDSVAESGFDVVLANINRSVLMASSEILYEKMKSNGLLLLSGILEQDKELVLDKYRSQGFIENNILQKGKWLCIKMTKHTSH